jgi:hypothetical protein
LFIKHKNVKNALIKTIKYWTVINTYKTLVRKPEGKSILRKCRHDWKIILKWIINE